MSIIKVADLGISSGVSTPAFEVYQTSSQTPAIYKNGSSVKSNTALDTNGSSLQTAMMCISAVLDLSVGDYIEAYINANIDSGTFTTLSSASGTQTRFSGYKLIGV